MNIYKHPNINLLDSIKKTPRHVFFVSVNILSFVFINSTSQALASSTDQIKNTSTNIVLADDSTVHLQSGAKSSYTDTDKNNQVSDTDSNPIVEDLPINKDITADIYNNNDYVEEQLKLSEQRLDELFDNAHTDKKNQAPGSVPRQEPQLTDETIATEKSELKKATDNHADDVTALKKNTNQTKPDQSSSLFSDLTKSLKVTPRIFTLTNKEKYPANLSKQPYKNIRASIQEMYQDSIHNFELALPTIRKNITEASQAVGYYDVSFEVTKTSNNEIEILVNAEPEPVVVTERFVDIRGAGDNEEVFKNFEQNYAPLEDNIFNHGEFDNSNFLLEQTVKQNGYFDGAWLSKSADIILPDNTAEIAVVYETEEPYYFDDIVFFTIDESTGKATTDPDKLPVNKELLYQLIGFKKGDQYNGAKVNALNNQLASTRYFNNFSIEAILPNSKNIDEAESINDFSATPLDMNTDATDIALVAFTDGISDKNIDELYITTNTNKTTTSINNHITQKETRDSAKNNSLIDNLLTASIQPDQDNEFITTINFSIDTAINDTFATITSKAQSLLQSPDNEVLDEVVDDNSSILATISNNISTIAKKILPDDDESVTLNDLENKRTPQEVYATKKIPLYILVMSNKPHDAKIGIGYGTDSGMRATAKIEDNLINKEGYQAGIATELSKIEKKVSIYANRPLSHPLDDVLNGKMSYTEEKLVNNGGKNWLTKSLTTGIARNRHALNGWNRSYSLKYRYDELDVGEDTQAIANKEKLPIKFTASQQKQEALILGYSMHKTTTDNITNPTKGFRRHFSIEGAKGGLASDTDIVIAKATVSGLTSFGESKKHQVIGKVHGSYMWSEDFAKVPYGLRFFAGGDQSIRGYDYKSLSPSVEGYLTGGEILAFANAEYNYEFKENFRGAIFADVGNAYDKDMKSPTKTGVGFGIRWASPIGPVRLDIGAGVSEESIPVRLHLFIGSSL